MSFSSSSSSPSLPEREEVSTRSLLDGCRSIDEAIARLHDFIDDDLDAMKREGWRFDSRVCDGYGDLTKDDDAIEERDNGYVSFRDDFKPFRRGDDDEEEELVSFRTRWILDGATTLDGAIWRVRLFIEKLQECRDDGWDISGAYDDYVDLERVRAPIWHPTTP